MHTQKKRRPRPASVSGNAAPSIRSAQANDASSPSALQALRNARLAYLSKPAQKPQPSPRRDRSQTSSTTHAARTQSRRRSSQKSTLLESEPTNALRRERVSDLRLTPKRSPTGHLVHGQPGTADEIMSSNGRGEGSNHPHKLGGAKRQPRSEHRNRLRSPSPASKTRRPPREHNANHVDENTGTEQQQPLRKQGSTATGKKIGPSQSPSNRQPQNAKPSRPTLLVTNSTNDWKSRSQTAVKTTPTAKSSSSTRNAHRSSSSSSSFLSLFAAKPSKQPSVECTICSTDRPASQTAKLHCCQTTWCHKCLEHVFRQALATPSSFAHPTCACHKAIDLAHVRPIFKHDRRFQLRWNATLDEHTLAARGSYCPNPRCARWIHPRHIARPRPATGRAKATCRACGAEGCARCGGRWHGGRAACPEGSGERMFAALVRAQGWQACPACGRVVERIEGCNHMRCAPGCGVEFCYRCGGLYDLLHECPRGMMDADGEGVEGAVGWRSGMALERPVNVFDYLQTE